MATKRIQITSQDLTQQRLRLPCATYTESGVATMRDGYDRLALGYRYSRTTVSGLA